MSQYGKQVNQIYVTNNSIVNDCNWYRTQNHLVRKRILNHLAKLAK